MKKSFFSVLLAVSVVVLPAKIYAENLSAKTSFVQKSVMPINMVVATGSSVLEQGGKIISALDFEAKNKGGIWNILKRIFNFIAEIVF